MASFLEKQGLRAFALKGGYMAWLKAGYPIERKEATRAMPLKMVCPECGEPLESHASHAKFRERSDCIAQKSMVK